MNLLDEVKKLRELIDEWYSNTEPHNRYDSDMYLEADNRLNAIQGYGMDLLLKLKEVEK